MMRHLITGSGYPIVFLISEFKRSSTLERWLNFLKQENKSLNPDIFMVDDAAQQQILKALDEWRKIGDENIKEFANYFEHWWKPSYEMWIVCARDMSHDMMDTNNLIEAFHSQLHIYDDNKENEYVDDDKEGEYVNPETYDRNLELIKLQEDLTSIFDE
ncbi:hypothetical protein F8M41_006636 [Gigaspora margarita]|uniref:Uncharacterized protein n=1 Tax=Gigaspora margarita TaxID=4874 RepID=A0A8H3X8S6_GIGMA|nr:hypothetical protein F8M41_006636 [Gigaspora margarita]